MIKYLLIFALFPCKLFSQTVSKETKQTNLKNQLKQLTDSNNYIGEKARMSIIDHLHSKHLDPKNYYVDSSVSVHGDTLLMNVWDIVGITTINKIEKIRDSLRQSESKLKMPYPAGNPGNCFTAYFDNKSKKLLVIDIWQ